MNQSSSPRLAAVLLLGLCACKADRHGAQEEHEIPVEHQPVLSLAAGIAIAQQSEPGTQFLGAEIENEGGRVICSVVLGKGEAAREVNIDAGSGKIVNTENEKLHKRSSALVQALAKDATLAATTPAQAIEAARAKFPGSWALEAKLEKDDGAYVYEIVLAGGKEPRVAVVSATDGVLKKVEELENEEAEEGEGKEKD